MKQKTQIEINKEIRSLMQFCKSNKEALDRLYKIKHLTEVLEKQGIQKAIEIIGKWRGQLEDIGFITIDKHFVNELIEKLNQEVENENKK